MIRMNGQLILVLLVILGIFGFVYYNGLQSSFTLLAGDDKVFVDGGKCYLTAGGSSNDAGDYPYKVRFYTGGDYVEADVEFDYELIGIDYVGFYDGKIGCSYDAGYGVSECIISNFHTDYDDFVQYTNVVIMFGENVGDADVNKCGYSIGGTVDPVVEDVEDFDDGIVGSPALFDSIFKFDDSSVSSGVTAIDGIVSSITKWIRNLFSGLF